MRFALLAAGAACVCAAPVSAAIWTFDVSGIFAMTGQQTTQVCTGGVPSCYVTEIANRDVMATYRVSVNTASPGGTIFNSTSSFGGWSFDPSRSYVGIDYAVIPNNVLFTSAYFTGDLNAHFPCFPGYVGCVNNGASAPARSLGWAFISSSDATAPVPEPATWAMMIGGFGLTGAAMRRRMFAHHARG